MEISAKASNIRMSSKKVRLIADLVRGKQLAVAFDQLNFSKKSAARPVYKLLFSAKANAEHNFNLQADNLLVKSIQVNEAPRLKRWMPKAHGRATSLHKHGSHILVTLAEIKDTGEHKARSEKVDAPVKLNQKPVVDEGVKVAKKDDKAVASETELDKGAKTNDPRYTGRSGHAKVEGSTKGFVGKMFQRKSG
jgi:large subunit ribosomal protein L22